MKLFNWTCETHFIQNKEIWNNLQFFYRICYVRVLNLDHRVFITQETLEMVSNFNVLWAFFFYPVLFYSMFFINRLLFFCDCIWFFTRWSLSRLYRWYDIFIYLFIVVFSLYSLDSSEQKLDFHFPFVNVKFCV